MCGLPGGPNQVLGILSLGVTGNSAFISNMFHVLLNQIACICYIVTAYYFASELILGFYIILVYLNENTAESFISKVKKKNYTKKLAVCCFGFTLTVGNWTNGRVRT